MKLSTGKIAFPIEFDNGDKDCIYFNPNDPDLFIRLCETEDRIRERIKNLSEFEMNADGTPKKQEDFEVFQAYRNILCEEMNRAFGSDVSSVLFKYVNPMGIVNGTYYILYVIEQLTPEITKHIKKATKDISKKMQAYIGEYIK